MSEDCLRTGKTISAYLGVSLKHLFYLVQTKRLGVEKVTGTLQLRKSVHHAWLFALAERGARWTPDDKDLIAMHLAVRKAAELREELARRKTTVAELDGDELICWAEVMEDAVKAAYKVLVIKDASNGVTDFMEAAEARLEQIDT